ncbi:type VII secretion-associated serine protease mycosin [Saccharothrix sp. ALI-22-I]|uniref:type VII secretion-associated serine protease mycosin n=1 Tax=Saccharothrix sp. ALI-22-I TaxID=1933778 RepID=UPI00097BB387|nr:type VII secretion-associated serine protease mycosin [Saccharothrix sp. ALI-22-I]ONI92876.1 type VII secretion-associated serine protease mycosin [Saccharothrix sp. ALI-22-I]
MKRLTSLLAAALLAAAVVSLTGAPAVAAPPTGACRDPEPAHPVVAERPWAQLLLDPRRVWPHSTGAGVLIAVVDSGVDADHPQLRSPGKVLPGRDFFLVGELPGSFDCVSHGTAVASIAAADPVDGVGFHGVAPGARILPVRITDRELSDGGRPTPIDRAVLARGIRFAADQGARVINLSLSGYQDDAAVRDAVAYAVGKDALVVAAVGNRQGEAGTDMSYPAAYDGVLGVGSLDITGTRTGSSQVGDYVDLVAPGQGVLGATRVAGHDHWDGTSFAAPFVAGTAALVRSAWPELSAAQVARRLLATATPAPGGRAEYGAGVVDPYRAVTDGLSVQAPGDLPAVVEPVPDPAAVRAAAWWDAAGANARRAAGAVALGLLVALGLGWALSRGRRRGWLPGRAAPQPVPPVREEPPEQMFLLPPPPAER